MSEHACPACGDPLNVEFGPPDAHGHVTGEGACRACGGTTEFSWSAGYGAHARETKPAERPANIRVFGDEKKASAGGYRDAPKDVPLRIEVDMPRATSVVWGGISAFFGWMAWMAWTQSPAVTAGCAAVSLLMFAAAWTQWVTIVIDWRQDAVRVVDRHPMYANALHAYQAKTIRRFRAGNATPDVWGLEVAKRDGTSATILGGRFSRPVLRYLAFRLNQRLRQDPSN